MIVDVHAELSIWLASTGYSSLAAINFGLVQNAETPTSRAAHLHPTSTQLVHLEIEHARALALLIQSALHSPYCANVVFFEK